MLGTLLDRPKRLVLWEAYSVQGPSGLTEWAEISNASYGANLEQSSGVRTRGGGTTRRRTRHLGLHEGVLERDFQNWPLRPQVPSAVYHRIKYGHVRTKRASATRAQSCDFGPSLRFFLRGAPKGVFDRGGNILRMRRGRRNAHLSPISGTGGVPNSRMHAQACPLVTWPRKWGFGTPPHSHIQIFDTLTRSPKKVGLESLWSWRIHKTWVRVKKLVNKQVDVGQLLHDCSIPQESTLLFER